MLIEASVIRNVCNALIKNAEERLDKFPSLEERFKEQKNTAETILYYVNKEEEEFGKEYE